ncbi:MAG: DUF1573 domain-containing protein [Saprospiraceae bacterium]|nr:DUF1573 domain-containing protein [Saprospiraceae bacterium]
MNRYLLMLLCLGICGTFTLTAQTIIFPDLEKNPEDKSFTCDFGELVLDTRAERVVKFKNTGDVPLIIPYMKRSWSYAWGKLSKEILLPEEEAELTIIFEAKYTGPFTKYITIGTNDPKNETIRFRVKGVVVE